MLPEQYENCSAPSHQVTNHICLHILSIRGVNTFYCHSIKQSTISDGFYKLVNTHAEPGDISNLNLNNQINETFRLCYFLILESLLYCYNFDLLHIKQSSVHHCIPLQKPGIIPFNLFSNKMHGIVKA